MRFDFFSVTRTFYNLENHGTDIGIIILLGKVSKCGVFFERPMAFGEGGTKDRGDTICLCQPNGEGFSDKREKGRKERKKEGNKKCGRKSQYCEIFHACYTDIVVCIV